MSVNIDYIGVTGAGTYTRDTFGTQVAPSGGIIVGGILTATSQGHIRWNGTNLSTAGARDLNLYSGDDYASDIETSPTAGSYTLDSSYAGTSMSWAAILSGVSGNYTHQYFDNNVNPTGITSYVGGIALICGWRRTSYPTLAITDGGTNLTVQAQQFFTSYLAMRQTVWSIDTTSTTLNLTDYALSADVFCFEASAGSSFVPKVVTYFM